ncbi:hypothetical protein B0A50_00324 [Salinomyces thailandicus]|uniref:Uncharacterized protein n=1 Tax=Salinomyces thailandicus TaxID=706561 RepID=A0A4U0UFL9_9PEZI|nr:hypothetical protein B0A50_00324 [Salinomyces thailandica]
MLLDHLTDPFTMAAQNNFFVSSPAVALPTAQPDQCFVATGLPTTNGDSQTPLFAPNGSTIPPAPGSIAGRKRSRGDIAAVDEEEDERRMMEDGGVPSPERQEPENSGMAVDGLPKYTHNKRPSVSSRKSQRRQAGTSDSVDLAQLVLPPQIREATTEPLIDEATRVLGISWTRMDATEATRISQAAYAKWIQNHYPGLRNVAIWFENSAIPGYLVEGRNAYTGQQEFYIFSNDLTEARLVTSESTQLVPRLKMLPALHLAAPGGHIRAETDQITLSQIAAEEKLIHGTGRTPKTSSQLRGPVQDHLSPSEAGAVSEPSSICAAHSMELD